jgi:predicted HTH transcriptional regulator
MSEKLNEIIVTELLKLKDDGNLFHRESQNLEFKESFNLAGLADYYRDFAAFANNKGGYLIFGVKDRPKRELVGLSEKATKQFDKLDPEMVSGHLLDIFSSEIVWEHEIYFFNDMYFGVFYIHESTLKPVISKKDEGKDQVLKNGEIYYRYGGRTQKIQYGELESIINKRIEQNNNQWLDLVQKIGKSGPQNAAILDSERG